MEIPNNIKLQSDIGEEKLIILDLIAHDNVEKAKDFISKKGIKYKNAFVSKEVLDNYFVDRFPTTLLIGPDGRILAKDLRGEKLTEIVKTKMEKL